MIQQLPAILHSPIRLMRRKAGRMLALLSVLAIAFTAPAASAPPPAGQPPAGDVNETTVGIVTGGVTGTYIQFASDLANVLDSAGKLRVLAVLGKGSLQNVEDILRVRGIDLGIVQSDVLAYIKRQGLFPGVENRLQYITKLYNEEFHLLTGEEIGQLEDLRGRKVNFGLKGSGIAITASIVFDLLKIEVEPVYDDPSVALDKLKRGEIAASAGVYGKPAKLYDGLRREDKVKFLPVPATLELSNIYFPSALSGQDYPNLIGPDERVETLAVGAIMVVFGWERGSWRYNKVARFVDMFFANLDQFRQPPRHQKWQEVNLAAQVPGWVRFPAADEALKRMAAAAPPPAKPVAASATSAPDTGSATDEKARMELFEAFNNWRKTQPQQ